MPTGTSIFPPTVSIKSSSTSVSPSGNLRNSISALVLSLLSCFPFPVVLVSKALWKTKSFIFSRRLSTVTPVSLAILASSFSNSSSLSGFLGLFVLDAPLFPFPPLRSSHKNLPLLFIRLFA